MIVRPLTEYCTLNMGQSPDSKTYNTQGNGLPFYQGNADFGETHPITRVWCSAPVKVAEDGDILISVRAPIGAMNMAVERCCIGRGLAALTPIRNKCSKLFLYYALQSKVDSLIAQGTGSTFKAISKKVLEATCIPAYSTIEQVQIAEIIGRVDSTIAARRNQLFLLDQLVKSRFIELFGEPEHNPKGWPLRPLGELCSVGSSKRIYQDEQSHEGVPFWRISDLVNKIDTGAADSNLFIPAEKYSELKQLGLVPIAGDVLVTSRGTLGRCYIVKAEDRFYFQDGMISWLSKYSEEITPLYLQYLFTMSSFRKQIDSMQAGSTVAYLSISMLKQLQVMIPNRTTQQQFAALVEQTDKSKYYSSLSFRYCQTAANTYRQEWMTCRTSDF